MAQQQFLVELGYQTSTLRYKREGITAGYIGRNVYGGASYVVEAESAEAARSQLGWFITGERPDAPVRLADAHVRLATEAEITQAQQFTAELIEAKDVFQSQLRESATKIWRVSIDTMGGDGYGLMQNEALTIHQTRETFGLNSSDGPEWLVAAATADEAEEKVIEFLASQSVEVTPAEEGEVEEFRQQVEACKRDSRLARESFVAVTSGAEKDNPDGRL